MNSYPILTQVRISTNFTVIGGAPADPTTVVLTLTAPDGSSPPPGPIVKDSVGNYHSDLVLNQRGIWLYQWQGSGALIVATPVVAMRAL